MQTLEKLLDAFVPFNEQEARDKEVMVRLLEQGAPIWERESPCHLTASAWVINAAGTKALMAFHNIYHAWSWLGGHADGVRDLSRVALREVKEESGVESARLLSDEIFSVEILTVDGHEKRGRYVPSHLHLNVTFLVQADDGDALASKADENSDVSWFDLESAPQQSCEVWMRERIYDKLNKKLKRMRQGT